MSRRDRTILTEVTLQVTCPVGWDEDRKDVLAEHAKRELEIATSYARARVDLLRDDDPELALETE